jgi:serine/threonine protein kinase
MSNDSSPPRPGDSGNSPNHPDASREQSPGESYEPQADTDLTSSIPQVDDAGLAPAADPHATQSQRLDELNLGANEQLVEGAAVRREANSIGPHKLLQRLEGGGTDEVSPTPDPFVTLTHDLSAERPDLTTPGCYRVGQEVGGFRLLREIGSGGVGQVFEAEDPILKRPVAIKFLLAQAHARPEAREQFLTEAQSMAAIQHDHVVPIFQVGQVDSSLFLVMPLLVGETLAQRLKREGSLPPTEVRRIGRELCLGLSALHAKGLLHRDIKPANLWQEMTSRRVKLLDLGLADDASNLRAGSSAGSPAYMSPEQVDGRDLDFRSDLFSVGAVLYECATGRRAFAGRSITEVIEAVRQSQPAPVREVNPGVPTDLADLVSCLLSKERNARPASALDVSEALQSQASVSTNSSSGLPASSEVSPRSSPRVRIFALAGLLTLVGTIVLLWVFFKPPAVEPSVPNAGDATNDSSPAATLAIENLQVIPWKIEGDHLKEAMPPLGVRDHVLPTTSDAIEVVAKLSRPAYAYIVLYRSDGKDYLLFPQDDTEIPPSTDQPRYPSIRPDVRYVLDDGPGIWAVAILASDTPLPSYREWREKRPDQPWKPQADPTRLKLALLDNGQQWRTLGNNRSFSRGERQFKMEPYQQQMDWLKRQVDHGAVMGVAFPVR